MKKKQNLAKMNINFLVKSRIKKIIEKLAKFILKNVF